MPNDIIRTLAIKCVDESRRRTSTGPDYADVEATVREALSVVCDELFAIRDRYVHRLPGYDGPTCTLCGTRTGDHDLEYSCGLVHRLLQSVFGVTP